MYVSEYVRIYICNNHTPSQQPPWDVLDRLCGDDGDDDDDDDDDGDGCKDGVLACTAPIGVTSQPDYRDTAQAQSGQFLWAGPPNQK